MEEDGTGNRTDDMGDLSPDEILEENTEESLTAEDRREVVKAVLASSDSPETDKTVLLWAIWQTLEAINETLGQKQSGEQILEHITQEETPYRPGDAL